MSADGGTPKKVRKRALAVGLILGLLVLAGGSLVGGLSFVSGSHQPLTQDGLAGILVAALLLVVLALAPICYLIYSRYKRRFTSPEKPILMHNDPNCGRPVLPLHHNPRMPIPQPAAGRSGYVPPISPAQSQQRAAAGYFPGELPAGPPQRQPRQHQLRQSSAPPVNNTGIAAAHDGGISGAAVPATERPENQEVWTNVALADADEAGRGRKRAYDGHPQGGGPQASIVVVDETAARRLPAPRSYSPAAGSVSSVSAASSLLSGIPSRLSGVSSTSGSLASESDTGKSADTALTAPDAPAETAQERYWGEFGTGPAIVQRGC